MLIKYLKLPGFICLFLLIFSISFSQKEKGGNYEESFYVEGTERSYLLHLPFGYSYIKDKKFPLVVFLHGNGGTGRASAFESKFNRIADREKFIIVYPNGYEKSWNDSRAVTKASIEDINDSLFISKLIYKLVEAYPIDENKIYIGGVSNGGFMAQAMVCKSDIKFAALFSVIANFPESLLDSNPGYNCSVLYMLGTEDPYVPYAGGYVIGNRGKVLSAEESIQHWKKMNNCNEHVHITTFPDTDKDTVSVKKYTYDVCENSKKLVLFKIIKGGHQYPSGFKIPTGGNMCKDINASEEIWKFLQSESLLNN
jgi:polyhydroxybutyrate depolymerase